MGSMLLRMRSPHFIRVACTAAIGVLAVALTITVVPRAQTPVRSTFLVFLRSRPIGNEQITVEKTAAGSTITSSGRVGAPLDLVVRNLQLKYDAEWKPLE